MGKNRLNLMTIRETEEVTERGQEDKEVEGKLVHTSAPVFIRFFCTLLDDLF